MKPSRSWIAAVFAPVAVCASIAGATERVITFEDLNEGFYGVEFWHQGITYRNINQVSGTFPTGETFEPDAGIPDNFAIERATFLYNDFPEWGSPHNALTFANAIIPGDNLSIGRISSVTMDLDELAEHVSFDMVYYENGPWGGISYRLDALLNGEVVASDSFVIADGGGRDNIAFGRLEVNAPAFDQLHFYAWYNGGYSLPRAMIDDLTIRSVSVPACPADFNNDGVVNTGDITEYLSAWFAARASGETGAADFNDDGAVNTADITAFLSSWFDARAGGC